MTREDTQLIKGIAILMMLFLHLFNDAEATSGLHSLVYIQGVPLCHWLTRAAGPVEFYLLVGGYGLYAAFAAKRDQNRYRRLVRLFVIYWTVLLLFVPFACLYTDDPCYPGTPRDILLNIAGIACSWYRECWFLLPYAILSACHPLLFRLLERLGSAATLAAAFLVYALTVVVTQRDWLQVGQDDPFVLLAVHTLQFLFPFCLGAVLKRGAVVERLKTHIPEKGG